MAIPVGLDLFLIFGVVLTFVYYLYQKWKLESRYSISSFNKMYIFLHLFQFFPFQYTSKAYDGSSSSTCIE